MDCRFPGAHHCQAYLNDIRCCMAMQGADEEDASQALVAIDSLGGRQMQLYLHKRPGYEAEDVLGGDDMEPSMPSTLDGHAVLSRARGAGRVGGFRRQQLLKDAKITGCRMPVELGRLLDNCIIRLQAAQ